MKKVALMISGMPNGRSTPFDGSYIKGFDFEYANGIGALLSVTKNPKEAMLFDDMEKALDFYKTQPKCKPIRNDGLPNRPLTATNIAFETIDL